MMKDCGNEGLDDTNKNTMNDGIDPENEDVIHRDKNENEAETNRNTLDTLI